jgi:hypothetical protein
MERLPHRHLLQSSLASLFASALAPPVGWCPNVPSAVSGGRALCSSDPEESTRCQRSSRRRVVYLSSSFARGARTAPASTRIIEIPSRLMRTLQEVSHSRRAVHFLVVIVRILGCRRMWSCRPNLLRRGSQQPWQWNISLASLLP